jgi:hypothetical protein
MPPVKVEDTRVSVISRFLCHGDNFQENLDKLHLPPHVSNLKMF